MPKKTPKNAHFFYMLHFKEQKAKRGIRFNGGLSEVSTAASHSWKNMTPQQRGPFEKMAKDAKHGPQQVQEKLTSQGIPVSEIMRGDQEVMRAQKTMKATILDIVRNSYINNTMGSQEYYFIDGNYFIETSEKIFYCAEIALIKFTFEDGIVKKFHTRVNPERLPLGYLNDAKTYSEATHQLPFPPNASGEKNYAVILNDITKFLGNTPELPPLFTLEEKKPMIDSFLKQFCEITDADPKRYRVFPLHQLFFDLKEEATKNSIDEKPGFLSIHVAKAQLSRDQYMFLNNTACNYHEDLDCSKYCALSNAQRWAFTFADHICIDLNIPLVPSKHLPPEVDTTAANATIYNRSGVATVNESAFSMAGADDTIEIIEPEWETRSRRQDSVASSSFVQSIRAGSGPSSRNALGSRQRSGPSKKRAGPPVRNVNNPWNTSSSSTDSNPWNQQRDANNKGFSSDFDVIPLERSR